MEAVRSVLQGKDEPGLEWLGSDVCVPIPLPAGADTLEAIVTKLECVAKLIDPDESDLPGKRTLSAGDDRPMPRPELQYSLKSRDDDAVIKIVCWNIEKLHAPWRELVEMDADVALLQEVGTVPEDVRDRVEVSPYAPWLISMTLSPASRTMTGGPWLCGCPTG